MDSKRTSTNSNQTGSENTAGSGSGSTAKTPPESGKGHKISNDVGVNQDDTGSKKQESENTTRFSGTNSKGSDQRRSKDSRQDELWKEDIREAVEESHRLAKLQVENATQTQKLAHIKIAPPRITRSYYDRLREDEFYRVRPVSKKAKSYAALYPNIPHAKTIQKQQEDGFKSKGFQTNDFQTKDFETKDMDAQLGQQPDSNENQKRKSRKKKRLDQGAESEMNLDEGGNLLSYFDPKYVKPEYAPLLASSRNVVVGPPDEILRKYFGYGEDDELPEEFLNDNSPKAFILPKRLWKDFDDVLNEVPPVKTLVTLHGTSSTTIMNKHKEEEAKEDYRKGFTPDEELITKMKAEDQRPDAMIPRQPKHYGVEYLGRQPFQKHGMIGSNLNDASPGMLEHWEMKPLNVDVGGLIRRDPSDRRWKISEVTDTTVKVGLKEADLTDDKRPWYNEQWAEEMDPDFLHKNPQFTRYGPSPVGRSIGGRGDERGYRREGRPSTGYSDRSYGSDGSGNSCTCGSYSTSSSSSGSGDEESSGGTDKEYKDRKKKSYRKKSKDSDGKSTATEKRRKSSRGDGDGPEDKKEVRILEKKETGTDADPEQVPAWAPEAWKSPEGFRGWYFKDNKGQKGSVSAPDLKRGTVANNKDKDWLRAYYMLKRAQKEGNVEEIKGILGDSDSAHKFLHELEEEFLKAKDAGHEDPMERLPRPDLPTPREYPDNAPPASFNYYKSYPLYPTISSERYFEWFKDVDRLENPRVKKKRARPAGLSKSTGNLNINWDDPKEAAKWYSYGYRRPDTRPKPERPDYDTKDYVYDNARAIVLMPARRPIPTYIDDRRGTRHLLEPSGLVKKYVFRDDFGKLPEYMMVQNKRLGRPPVPDFDKFYRPHRCKYLHGHIHCKICMRAHPTVKHKKINWHCEMNPGDYEGAMGYRESGKSLPTHKNDPAFYGYHIKTVPDYGEYFDINNLIKRVAQSHQSGNDPRFGQGREQNFYEYYHDNSRNTNCFSHNISPPVYV